MEEFLRIVAAGGTPILGLVGYALWKLHLKLVGFDKRLVRIETLLDNHLKHLQEREESR
ncbi:hypothetical protein LCGC14_2149580 [marine sediment metagenome]|uniref:YvrJ family protein n=1 Tax=marine sediment metagenome TaxID=412755 RepID=A0A0F9DVS5_9ZZZZ